MPIEKQLLGQLKHHGVIATSDIGCYTLAVYPPLLALDTCACMGASVGQAHGLEKAGVINRTMSIIGDSTFIHSGITPLVDIVYNQGKSTVIILDNNTTAMTGHQGHPGTGISARKEEACRVVIEDICRGIGVRDVNVISAFDLPLIEATVRRCVEAAEPSVIVIRGDCPLNVRTKDTPLVVDSDKCDSCFTCLRVGCPAIVRDEDKVKIDPLSCVGGQCSLCLQVCPQEAIREGGKGR
jgi:indolepyruvate ferredoxin oxidoreductase alpha subunit